MEISFPFFAKKMYHTNVRIFVTIKKKNFQPGTELSVLNIFGYKKMSS